MNEQINNAAKKSQADREFAGEVSRYLQRKHKCASCIDHSRLVDSVIRQHQPEILNFACSRFAAEGRGMVRMDLGEVELAAAANRECDFQLHYIPASDMPAITPQTVSDLLAKYDPQTECVYTALFDDDTYEIGIIDSDEWPTEINIAEGGQAQ